MSDRIKGHLIKAIEHYRSEGCDPSCILAFIKKQIEKDSYYPGLHGCDDCNMMLPLNDPLRAVCQICGAPTEIFVAGGRFMCALCGRVCDNEYLVRPHGDDICIACYIDQNQST